MKIFLRTGAWYSSETPALSDDLELSSLLNNQPIITKDTVVCNCKNDIAALNERIDVLTKMVNEKNKITLVTEKGEEVKVDDKPASVPAKKSVPKKPVAKKAAAKKK